MRIEVLPAGDADRRPGTVSCGRCPSSPQPLVDAPVAEASIDPEPSQPEEHRAAVHWLADYVYGTIATLVAIAGLTFETNPGELTTAGVVIVGSVAIWFAHTLSRLVSMRSAGHMRLRVSDVWGELRHSWSIVTAAVPATLIFILAAIGLWSIQTAFVVADMVGVAALLVVGIGTAGGSDRPLFQRVRYVVGVVFVGVAIVLLEAGVHLL
jgi:hypothetical protein